MAAPNLPKEVVTMLANQQMREHHAFWHAAREWDELSKADRDFLTARGYKPPRLVNDAGAGLDFFYMHRKMIEDVNLLLSNIKKPAYSKVSGWNPIPFNHNDADYPMPPVWDDPNFIQSKNQQVTDFWRKEVTEKFENDVWLKSISLDRLGSAIEGGIHNWLHLHWSAEPWFKSEGGQDENDERNDFLGSTYSSHVNKIFWKLHGWIDDRINQWEKVNNKKADFSNAWIGPSHHHHISTEKMKKTEAQMPESLKVFSDNFFSLKSK